MEEALREIEKSGCSFVVGGRKVGNEFLDATSFKAPKGFENLFIPIPAFRMDISSTELRLSGKNLL